MTVFTQSRRTLSKTELLEIDLDDDCVRQAAADLITMQGAAVRLVTTGLTASQASAALLLASATTMKTVAAMTFKLAPLEALDAVLVSNAIARMDPANAG